MSAIMYFQCNVQKLLLSAQQKSIQCFVCAIVTLNLVLILYYSK